MEIYKDLTSPENQQFEKLLNSQLSKNVIEEGKYILIKDNIEIAIDFINKNTLQLKYKDNLGIDNLIRFSRSS